MTVIDDDDDFVPSAARQLPRKTPRRANAGSSPAAVLASIAAQLQSSDPTQVADPGNSAQHGSGGSGGGDPGEGTAGGESDGVDVASAQPLIDSLMSHWRSANGGEAGPSHSTALGRPLRPYNECAINPRELLKESWPVL